MAMVLKEGANSHRIDVVFDVYRDQSIKNAERFTLYEVAEVEELHCSHERADTRLLLHANHAARSSNAVIINAEDTDVMVIALSVAKQIPCKVYQKCGTKTRTRYIDTDNLADTLGEGVCRALPGLHAFTGQYNRPGGMTYAFFGGCIRQDLVSVEIEALNPSAA
ncbi:hypothetical protein Bbelb_377230 [Branchiostoma belcheri]|nr:hypothetical protein Bbelb_377230 [Branchiostoma belcheri]